MGLKLLAGSANHALAQEIATKLGAQLVQRILERFPDGVLHIELCEEVFAILNRHDCALCIHDRIADHPRLVTAGWVYLRFHGKYYGGCYSH